MAQVSNLVIRKQSGNDNTHFATWEFKSVTTPAVTNGAIRVGDWVKVKSGARWYNGVSIDSWVFNDTFRVIEVRGDRAVINENQSGTHHIMSPIHVNNLTGGTGTGGGTSVSADQVDHYTVKWAYDSGDGVWFSGGSSDVKDETNATYNAPNNALKIRVTVTPVSKTYKVNNQDTPYWTGSAVSAEYSLEVNPPEVPPVPKVTIEKYELTTEIDNISDPRTDEVQFEVYNGTELFSSGVGTVKACMVSYKCNVNAGGSYRVRARSINLLSDNKIYSTWSNFTSAELTIPSPPSEITTIRGQSATEVYLEWTVVNSAKTYDVEFATKAVYFDGSDKTQTVSGIDVNHYIKTGLESGERYFFRVRAVNEKGESGWCDPKSVVIGKKPAAPTTWSSSTTVVTGEPLNLYWVHNAEDQSRETYAELELTINGETITPTEIIRNETPEDEDEPEKTYSYSIDTSEYIEGTQIKWRVRTAGITNQFGDWSVLRTVDVYAPPTLELKVTDQNGSIINVLNSFPFFIKGLAGPNTQEPIGYHTTITADRGYETVDSIGRPMIVNPGDVVYSRYIDTNDPLLLEMSAGNVDFESGVSYTITVVVSMNSGLNATASQIIDVSWTDIVYNLDTQLAVDKKTYVAYITPFCRDEEGLPIEDVTLAVYRREFDGTYTELQTGLDPMKNTVITDPHPALDYARYRIVATDNSTGAVSFYDPPGYPVQGKEIVIQWDEAWTSFDVTNEDELEHPLWNGSILKLPYNIDVSDNSSPDSELVGYIGRTYPVAYYGTQIAASASWAVEVPKSDRETLYTLRRLAIWRGDVYVREPSGSGYWANISVSFSQKHCEMTIPVSLEVTRVDGGV